MKKLFALAATLIALPVAAAPPRDTPAGEQRFRELYKELVETNTTLSAGNCTLAAERMAARLQAAGLPESDLHAFAAPGHEKEGGLVAVYPGRDPKLKAILLLAHIDVVEAKREDWTRDPFTLVEENGSFYARGAMIVSRPRCNSAIRRCAAAAISSSPAWVLTASHKGRAPIRSRSSASAPGSAARGSAAALRSPTLATADAPSRRNRSAWSSSCARHSAKVLSIGRIMPGSARQRACERSDSRPFRRSIGMPRRWVDSTKLGHSSDSTQIARSGRQWSRNRDTGRGRSIGTN